MYDAYSVLMYIYSIFIDFFKKLFFFINIKYLEDGKRVKWNPNLYTIDYTYSKDEYDRKYKRNQENYNFFSFN